MLFWCIKVFILAALLVTLGHFVLEHFNERLNQPKIHKYDASYEKILNVLETSQKEPCLVQPISPSPDVPTQHVSSDTTSIDNLPVCDELNMEESLKDFIVNNT